MPPEEIAKQQRRLLPSSEQPTSWNAGGGPPAEFQEPVSLVGNSNTRRARVSRTMINLSLDALLMFAFMTLAITSVIVQFVFPPGVATRGWTLWGMSYGQWCGLQFGLLSILGFGIVVHVMLHWAWVCTVITRQILHRRKVPDDGIRTVYGVSLLIILLISGAAIIGLAMLSIKMPSN